MPAISGFGKRVCAWGILAALPTVLSAQTIVVPQGGEFSILGPVPGDQVHPSLSLSSSGRACLVWQDNVIDGKGAGVGGSLLSGSDFSAGRMFRVNKTATGNQINPQIQVLAGGNLLMVWQSSVTGVSDIYARSAKNGTNFFTADVRVNSYVKDANTHPAVAALADGSAIVVWQSHGQDTKEWGVYARKLLKSGLPTTGKEFLVNQFKSNQRNPAVAALANGNFVVVWVSDQQRSLVSSDVYARIFSAGGVALSDELPVNPGVTNFCSNPQVAALNDGGFTVVWAAKDLWTPTNGWDIWGRAFSAVGQPTVAAFRINTYLYGDQYLPRIASGPSGCLVVWTSLAQDGDREGVFGRFLAGGSEVSGKEFQVNTTWTSMQIHPCVAWDGMSQYLVVWSSFSGSSGFDLYGQAYVLSSSSP